MNSDPNYLYPRAVPTAPTLYPMASALNNTLEQQNVQPQQHEARPEVYKTPQIVIQPLPGYAQNIFPGTQQTPNSTPSQAEGSKPNPNIVVINNGMIPFGYKSQKTVCSACKQETQTILKHRPTFRTHVMALIFCATGFWCLVPLPYCMKSCQKMEHYCNKCKQYIGHSGK